MVEKLHFRTREERESNNLTFKQYLHSKAIIFMAPVIGFAGGYLLSHKIMPNSFLGRPYFDWAKPSAQILEEEAGIHLDIAEIEKEASGIKMGEGWGAKFGLFIGLFSIWRDDTKERIDIHRLDGGFAHLQQMQSYNQFIAKETEHLAQQNMDIASNDNRYLELENQRISAMLATSKPGNIVNSTNHKSEAISHEKNHDRKI